MAATHMIITRLIGGLGNQMFQYAAGFALAHRTGQKLRVDITSLRDVRAHQGYQLPEIFCGDFCTANWLDLFKVLGFSKRQAVHGSATPVEGKLPNRLGPTIRQPTHNFWNGFNELGAEIYLVGYWQSAKYFHGFETILAETFKFRENLTGRNAEIAMEMEDTIPVALHVRRGDYIQNPKTYAFHGICHWDYYHKAMDHIRKRVRSPHFYIFSDDLQAAIQEFGKSPETTYVDCNNGSNSYRDMMLMARCKHHIIANSSFSWWGAWLANAHGYADSEQIVIAPEQWLSGSKEQMEDIYIKNWVRF
ncbi:MULTISPECIES: alpha-1,2-fucosyltransferase [unclassified Roseobacter]|uniref:alpha-1,2-fucosyltransferase n=1 Tax=unclassified Roseobacter TaxID=196798 RepID=UPI0030EDFE78